MGIGITVMVSVIANIPLFSSTFLARTLRFSVRRNELKWSCFCEVGETGANFNTGHVATLAPIPSRKCLR